MSTQVQEVMGLIELWYQTTDQTGSAILKTVIDELQEQELIEILEGMDND